MVSAANRVQINGRPFVVREADKPFQNLEYTGIDRTRVEDMERRLKADVLREVSRVTLAYSRFCSTAMTRT
jgi:Inositol hexakisphosphate